MYYIVYNCNLKGGVLTLRKPKIISPIKANTKEKLVSFRITDEEYVLLKELSNEQCRTVSNCIRYTLKDILEDYRISRDKVINN